MAQTTSVGVLTEGLIEVITKYDKKEDARAFKACHDACSRNLRHHRFARTNQFEVHQSLDGLIERFSITNKEPLAEGLQLRLDELRSRDDNTTKWLPEVLSLFLHLADRPAELSSVERLDDIRPRTPPAEKLTWRDIFGDEYDDLAGEAVKLQQESESNGESDAWYESEAYSDDGHVSDVFNTSLDIEVPRVKAEDLIVPTDRSYLDELQQAQAWRQQGQDGYAAPISEGEATRECLHVLQGLPSILFDDFKPNGQYYIETLSSSGFHSILCLFGKTGQTFKQLSSLGLRCESSVQRTFWQQVEQRLLAYNEKLTGIEKSLAYPDGPTVVSLLELQTFVEGPSRELIELAKIAEAIHDDVRLLDRIYDGACEAQAIGEMQVYQTLSSILYASLNSYLRLVLRWVTAGQLVENDTSFLITEGQDSNNLSMFWEQRYELRLHEGKLLTPRFLQPSARTLLSLGKQVAFLSQLDLRAGVAHSQIEPAASPFTLTLAEDSNDLTPYSSQLASALRRWIESCQGPSSLPLKHHLQQTLGLSRTLRALGCVYLSMDGTLTQAFADPIFARLDAGRRSWNDPWFLETCAHDAYVDYLGIDARSLEIKVKTTSKESRKTISGRPSEPVSEDVRSVKVLSTVAITLDIHEALQNIIRPHQISTYQAAFTFLLQLYRGCSALTKLRVKAIAAPDRQIALPLRQRVLHTLTTVTSHVLHAGIGAARAQLAVDLNSAEAVDAMIAAHTAFISRLEHCCLLAPHTTTVREAIIKLCDLAVFFSDSRSGPPATGSRPSEANPDDEENASDSSDDEPAASRSSLEQSVPVSHETDPQRLRGMLRQYSQLQAVIVAGLRTASRAEHESEDQAATAPIDVMSGFLGMLAEELESSFVSRRKRG